MGIGATDCLVSARPQDSIDISESFRFSSQEGSPLIDLARPDSLRVSRGALAAYAELHGERWEGGRR